MKKRFKRLGYFLGFLVLLMGLFLVVERIRGERALGQRLVTLKKQGEVLEVARIQPPLVASNENAFLLLATLTNRSDAILTNISEGPPSLEFVKPGLALVSWQLNHWESGDKETNDWTIFGSQLENAANLIQLLRSAANQPAYSSEFDYQKGFSDFQIGPLVTAKQGVQVLSAATLNDLRNHRRAEAHSNLCALVKLAVMQEPEPLVICQLVRFACASIAFNTTWQALQSPDWTDEQLAALQTIWNRARFAWDMERAMEMERAMSIDYFENLRASASSLNRELAGRGEIEESIFGSLPSHGFLLHHLHAPVWRFSWSAQDELRALNRWQLIIDRARFARSHSWAALSSKVDPSDEIYTALFLPEEPEKMNAYDRARYLFSNETFSISDLMIRKALQVQTLQRLAVTAIAIQRSQRASGKLPKNLNELLPQFLSEVPIDSMDGKPIRYGSGTNTKFTLYSVGYDGKDDGGDSSLGSEKKSYHEIWDGKDAVWPSATEEKRNDDNAS
ncbi:MAG TPA: hypothetical protein VIV82_12105 [Verrucomicrobiae bacterium]